MNTFKICGILVSFLHCIETIGANLLNSSNVVQPSIPAYIQDYPFLVSISKRVDARELQYSAFCLGALVRPNKVLTAAHCMAPSVTYRYRLSELYVLLGSSRALSAGGGGGGGGGDAVVVSRPSRVVYPDHYSYPNYDIAVVGLRYNDSVESQPIDVAVLDREYDSVDNCLALGYNTGCKKKSAVLVQDRVHVMGGVECARVLAASPAPPLDAGRFLCVYTDHVQPDECDSGAPLLCYDTGDSEQKGDVTVVGVATGRVGPVVFYQKVAKYSAWLARRLDAEGGAEEVE